MIDTYPPYCGLHEPGVWWFRVFGYGIHCADRRMHQARFSERNGLVKTLRVGPYALKWLRPWRPARPEDR